MKELLLELFSMVLEAPKVQTPKPSGQTSDSVSPEDQQAGTALPTRGGRWRAKQVGTNKILYWGDQEIAVAWAKGQRSDDGGEKDDAKIGGMGKEDPQLTAKKQQISKDLPQQFGKQSKDGQVTTPSNAPENLNAAGLAKLVRDGIVAPGNDFSRYSEAVSSFIAKYVVDNPNAPMEDVLSKIVELDCGSKTLTSGVGAEIPKKSARYQEYLEMEDSGVFDKCKTQYSRSQNIARFMTAIVAQSKGVRMSDAITNLQESGFLTDKVTVDAFSGDQQSLGRMRKMVELLPEGAKIFTETGEELSNDEAKDFLQKFGTSGFPADTALIAQDSNGNLVLIGFSDKKDLQAIINNSTVTKEFERTSDLLKQLLSDQKITQKQYDEISAQLERQINQFSDQESELKKVTASPATRLVELAETDPKQLQKFINKAKTLSSSKTDPEKYWRTRVAKFQKAIEKKATTTNEREHLQWLRKAGWNGKSPVSDRMALTAFAYKMQDMIERGEEDIPKDDQEVLFRLDVVDRTEMVDAIGKIRENTLEILQQTRKTLDQVSVQDIPLGTLIDGVRAWKGLHLDMGDYKGSLTMVAEDVVVDYKSIQECMQGINSMSDFAKNLQIKTRPITSREHGVVTGQNIEVFSVSPSGERLNVGVRSIRSKEGLLGRLQTTWTYHPDFQSCLAGKNK